MAGQRIILAALHIELMKWRKLGHLFSPDAAHAWNQSHAANPFAEHLEGNTFRICFTCRDSSNRSHISCCDIDLVSQKILAVSDKPLLVPGQIGLFDDSGVAMGWLITFQERKLLYYLGWNLKVTVPWMNTIGLAEFDAGTQTFVKHGRVPVMDRSAEDPFSISYPSVLEENGVLRMWYGSNTTWGADQAGMAHVIKSASSHDGVHWTRDGVVAVDLEHPGEYALSKPCVIKESNGYRMWYSYRANGGVTTYRIGCAYSPDGLKWRREDASAGIDVSPDGWDSEMICYPHVFDHDGERYMLYNGNGYGRTGFGLAVLD